MPEKPCAGGCSTRCSRLWETRTTTLLVCAADLVHAVPLDALPLGQGRVGDRFRIVNQVSFRRLVAPLPRAGADAKTSLLAIGGVAFRRRR